MVKVFSIMFLILLLGSCVQVIPGDEEADVAENTTQPEDVAEPQGQNPVISETFTEPPKQSEAAEPMLTESELGLLQPSSIIPEPEINEQLSEQIIEGLDRELSEAPAANLPTPEELREYNKSIAILCQEVGNKLGSISAQDCRNQNLQFAGSFSVHDRPLAMRDFKPSSEVQPKSRVLIMGGIHGDEYSSISIMFKWMEILEHSESRNFLWRFLPAVNPDGLLDGEAVRQNANGVDLNRNFPSSDWNSTAHDYWVNETGSNPRRYPGESAGSEPEIQWLIDQINSFKPDVIVSVHAPYHLLDFDGPPKAPEKIGELYLHQLGVYPGSLGNYGGIDLGIPVITLELPSAGIMPERAHIGTMWADLVSWLHKRLEEPATASR